MSPPLLELFSHYEPTIVRIIQKMYGYQKSDSIILIQITRHFEEFFLLLSDAFLFIHNYSQSLQIFIKNWIRELHLQFEVRYSVNSRMLEFPD